jgi:hypothetical protein
VPGLLPAAPRRFSIDRLIASCSAAGGKTSLPARRRAILRYSATVGRARGSR